MSLTRYRDFCLGRMCAHDALERQLSDSIEVKRGFYGEPVWPDGFTGSISHTPGLCLSIVAPKKQVIGIGIDAEHLNAVDVKSHGLVFTEKEIDSLRVVGGRSSRVLAACQFSVKEALFKCIFSVSAERLSFKDVTVHIEGQEVYIESNRVLPPTIRGAVDGSKITVFVRDSRVVSVVHLPAPRAANC